MNKNPLYSKCYNALLTIHSISCPERKSVCCGAISRPASGVELIMELKMFCCSSCGAEYQGGECSAKEKTRKNWPPTREEWDKMARDVAEKANEEQRKAVVCRENWDSIPFTSEHLWNADHHGIPSGACVKCGKPEEEWGEELRRRALGTKEILKESWEEEFDKEFLAVEDDNVSEVEVGKVYFYDTLLQEPLKSFMRSTIRQEIQRAVENTLISLLASSESMVTAKEIRHAIKNKLLNLKTYLDKELKKKV